MLYRVPLAISVIRTHTTIVVIDTDCTGSCKSNYHTIMTTTVAVRVIQKDCDVKFVNEIIIILIFFFLGFHRTCQKTSG
jgi:hypothetical protein